MSLYAKVTSVITLLVVAISTISLWFSISISTGSVQTSLDNRAKDAAALVALALNDVDLDSNLDLVEYIINGAFSIGDMEQVTLFDSMDRVKVERKKAAAVIEHTYGFVTLENRESMAHITMGDSKNGKIVLRSDATQAYALLEAKITELIKLFAIIGVISIILFAVTLKIFMRNDSQA